MTEAPQNPTNARKINTNATTPMLRNLWTVLAVCVCIFALASFLSAAKTREVRSSSAPGNLPASPTVAFSAEAQTQQRPTADSLPRIPPEGMLFAGHGRFQVYRQGDITWRLDTESGAACVLFATDEQWSRLQVVRRGCADH